MSVKLTPELRRQLESVNARNNAMPYVEDRKAHGKIEQWDDIRKLLRGDCEDYALGKRAELRELGWTEADLSLVTCWIPVNQYHMVLAVTHADGTLILDNAYPKIREWTECLKAGYKFDKRQQGSGWFSVPS